MMKRSLRQISGLMNIKERLGSLEGVEGCDGMDTWKGNNGQ